MISVTPIRYTRDVRGLADFYAVLGLVEKESETSRTWVRLIAAGGALGIHIASAESVATDARQVALEFTVDDGGLEGLHSRLKEAGHEPSAITDETFGRYFTVPDPDGYSVQINEVPEEFSRSYETEESRSLL